MAFRGFTWNMTATEAANLCRILSIVRNGGELRTWDLVIMEGLLTKAQIFLELTPDGTSKDHAHADA